MAERLSPFETEAEAEFEIKEEIEEFNPIEIKTEEFKEVEHLDIVSSVKYESQIFLQGSDSAASCSKEEDFDSCSSNFKELKNLIKFEDDMESSNGLLYENSHNIEDRIENLSEKLILKRLYQCGLCKKSFQNETVLMSHSHDHPSRCELRDKFHTESGSLSSHKYTHTGLRPYKCELCNKSFIQKARFTQHQIGHKGIRSFPCDICSEHFIQKAHLKTHRLQHADITDFKCNLCSISFTRKVDLNRHKCKRVFLNADRRNIEEGDESKKLIQCNICEKSFENKILYRNHMVTHPGARPFRCELCDKCFSTSRSLKYHMCPYKEDHPHKCEVCNKSFSLMAYLRKHERIHNKIHTFKCDICSKSFTQKTELDAHECIHTDNFPYQSCSLTSGSNSPLRVVKTYQPAPGRRFTHVQGHGGELPSNH
ncbi:hypothetical protein C0J52_22675 [Blattella germanica]|nr:hypothetical protein C0J52_22675 [Blattella germanica]